MNIEDKWREYRDEVLSHDINPLEEDRCMLSFHGGATVVIAALMERMLQPGIQPQDLVREISSISDQLLAFNYNTLMDDFRGGRN